MSAVGTYQMGLVAKALSKPFYALAESYKFLRHYPLSQTDLPLPRRTGSKSDPRQAIPLAFPTSLPPSSLPAHTVTAGATSTSAQDSSIGTARRGDDSSRLTREMIDLNPTVDITTPDLIDFIITDLGAPLSPTSVSQYLVAQFSG